MPRLVALQLGVQDGLVAALDEVWAAGDAALPLDPALPPDAVDRLAARLRPAELRTVDGHRRTDQDAPGVPDGTAVVVTTSGSTGDPSGVLLPWPTLDAAVAAQRAALGADDGQPWLGLLPLSHVAGLCLLLRSRAAGAEPALHARDDVATVDGAAPSWVSLVPTQLRRLLDAGARLDRHHGVLLGGAAASPVLLARAADAGVAVTTSYGMTETCGGCVYDGRPLDGVTVRVEDGGVLAVRGPVVATTRRVAGGRHEPLVDAAGWLATRDLGTVDDHGRVRVLGRADDVAVSGGENVPLAPVRRAVAALPEVAEAAVVALDDPRWGQAVTAVVVPARADGVTLDGLREALRGTLAPRHLPTRLVVTDTLPRDGLGKVTPHGVRRHLDEPPAG